MENKRPRKEGIWNKLQLRPSFSYLENCHRLDISSFVSFTGWESTARKPAGYYIGPYQRIRAFAVQCIQPSSARSLLCRPGHWEGRTADRIEAILFVCWFFTVSNIQLLVSLGPLHTGAVNSVNPAGNA
ncbi:uncharacterized protein LAJ45_09002 [Morchella importuna]|uniref:uncharacterized protein n=1 Tax=Morchella importuna TaxID=1174673 RepID=UPI001E8DB36E|nr:uncharacterized protein LAJ45_09002 [Morchella importuna]KAH8146922.1 hypothetical protein LAJ45_09002 [Morchella importuna]